MKNPRSTTFNLTSIQSRRGAPQSARKYSPRIEKTKPLGAIPDQENRLRNQVRELTIRNRNLSEFIQHFENSSSDLNERDNLIRDLQIVLIKHTASLERRMKKIDDIEKQVLIFRSVSNEEEEFDKLYPIKLPDESYRTKSARNNSRKLDFLPPPKYQKPKRRIFPPPKIEKTLDMNKTNPLTPLTQTTNLLTTSSDFNQINMSKEREKLIQKTLYLDRLISVEKLKLKLYHDHRTLSELKNELDIMQSEPVNPHYSQANANEEECNDYDYANDNQNNEEECFDDNEPDLYKLKNSIELIKERIEEEKKRISFFQSQYFIINDSAIDIQRTWRGYAQRKQQQQPEENQAEKTENNTENENQNNEISANEKKLNEDKNLNENKNLNEEAKNEEVPKNGNLNEEENLNEEVKNEKTNNNDNLNEEESTNEEVKNDENLNEINEQ